MPPRRRRRSRPSFSRGPRKFWRRSCEPTRARSDRLPYGYYTAAEDGCDVVYSDNKVEKPLERSFRLRIKSMQESISSMLGVWLFDQLPGSGVLKRWVFSRLIAKVDILTVLSPENLKVARTLFPHIRSEFVPFGINADEFAPLKKEQVHYPIRILSLGNDPHRDWQILIHSVKDLPDCYLKMHHGY